MGKKILNLGAGVQSSTLLLMSCVGDVDILDGAIFADTGWEPASVYRYLNYLKIQAQAAGIPLYTVQYGNLRDDMLAKRGGSGHIGQMPFYVKNTNGDGTDTWGQLWRKCTADYKILPIENKIRDLMGYKKRQRIRQGDKIEQWIGISLDEIVRAKASRQKWIDTRWPLIERRMTRHDCLQWLKKHGHPIPPKSACIGCPYHTNATWKAMALSNSQEWQDAVWFDEAMRTGEKLPGVTGNVYLHRRMLPLKEAVEIDLKAMALNENQEAFAFMDECEGVCFI